MHLGATYATKAKQSKQSKVVKKRVKAEASIPSLKHSMGVEPF